MNKQRKGNGQVTLNLRFQAAKTGSGESLGMVSVGLRCLLWSQALGSHASILQREQLTSIYIPSLHFQWTAYHRKWESAKVRSQRASSKPTRKKAVPQVEPEAPTSDTEKPTKWRAHQLTSTLAISKTYFPIS